MTPNRETVYAEKAHARYGPSSFDRLIHDPTSFFLSRDMPPKKPTAYSKDGHRAHDIAGMWLEDELNANKRRKVDFSVYSKEMRDCAKAYCRYVRSVVEPFMHLEYTWFIEQRLIIDKERDVWGTPDFVFIYKDTLGQRHVIVIDYKFGENVEVESKDNWQIIGYIYCAVSSFKAKFHTAEGHIFQPRMDHETPVQKWDVATLEENFFSVIDAAVTLSEGWFADGYISDEDLARYQQVGKWCRWCPAKAICKPYNAERPSKARSIFAKAIQKLEKKELGNKELLKDPGVLDPEDLVFLALNRSAIQDLIDGAHAAASSLLMKGHKLPGVKLIEQNPARYWISNTPKIISTLTELGIEPIVKTESLISMTAVEKILGKGKIDDLLTQSSEKSYKLVSEDHKSPGAEFGLATIKLFKERAAELTKQKKRA